MICPKCNKHYENGKFCPECGVPLIEEAPQQNASGISLNLGDANAISGGLHVADSHDVSNIDNSVHNVTDNSTTTITNINIAAQKTESEIIQDNENQFIKAVQQCLIDGQLDQCELGRLNMLALQLNISPQRSKQMIEQIRLNTVDINGGKGTDYIVKQLQDEVINAVNTNQVGVLQYRLSQLKQMAQTTPDTNIQFYYHMLQTSFMPESAAISFLNARSDNYWQIFWVHVAYVKLKQIDNATMLLPRLGVFGAPQGDIALLMSIDNLASYRSNPQQDYCMIQAQDKLMQAQQLGLNEPLNALWYAVKEAMLDEQHPEPWFQFYVEQTIKELCPIKVSAMPKMEIPPMPKFNAQDINLSQMQGFNPLQAAKQMGLGMAGNVGHNTNNDN